MYVWNELVNIEITLPTLISWIGLLVVVIIAGFTQEDSGRIPNILTGPSLLIALVGLPFYAQHPLWNILAAFVVLITLFLIDSLTPVNIGMGLVKLFFVISIVIGPLVICTILAMAATSTAYWLINRDTTSSLNPIPFTLIGLAATFSLVIFA